MPRGAKPGERRGGRVKGTPNKVNADLREKVLAKYKLTPLEYMMKVLNDTSESKDRRMWAAEKAAPYIHSKLESVTVSGDEDAAPVQHKVIVEFV